VLRGLNLQVMEGECVAVTGASGCGKSTLVKLILGLLDPTEGDILIGGARLGSLGPDNYRSLLGTVMQDDVLFAGSIADNLCFFDPAPDHEHMVECARRAEIHGEIARMSMGYNTLVGDVGGGLSGGQKQRLLLARALYKRPRILVLDEATSHLDVRNERAVNDAIQKLDLTRLIVAHRPETISMAQRVVILSAGTADTPSGDDRSAAHSS
jgi:ATP-binding cassette subfamily B protein RaxB